MTFQDILSCITVARGLDPQSSEEALDMVEAAFLRIQAKEDKSRWHYLGRRLAECGERLEELEEKWKDEQSRRTEEEFPGSGADSF